MIVRITEQNHIIYRNLSQPYEAEFAPLTGAETDENGEYPISTQLDDMHHGYLYYHNGKPVGFIVVEIQENLCNGSEVYILPAYRKSGLAKNLCFEVFDLYPCEWQLLQLKTAKKSHAFNLKLVNEYTQGNFIEDELHDPKWGDVYRQRFRACR